MSEMYTAQLEEQIADWVKNRLSTKRYRHVVGVVETIDKLARQYTPELVPQLRLAGWIHDAAKELPDEELITIAEEHAYPIREIEYAAPMLLHGIAGYFLANDQFSLDDDVIRSACQYHTSGAPEMTLADMVVYLGDLTEPGRKFEDVKKLRKMAAKDLQATMLLSLDLMIPLLIQQKLLIDPNSVLLRNHLMQADVHY